MRIAGNMMRISIRSIAFMVLGLVSYIPVAAQVQPLGFKQLQDSMSMKPKPVMLLLSTDWCVYCRMQKLQIRRDKKFSKESSRFYYAELNAESKERLKFKGRTYYFQPNGSSSGVHELAVALGKHNGTLAYPTWVVMDKEQNILYRHSGVLSRNELQLIVESLVKRDDPG